MEPCTSHAFRMIRIYEVIKCKFSLEEWNADDGSFRPGSSTCCSCFLFLQHVRDEFRSLYKERRIEKANAYGLDKDFGPHLRSAMHYYNTNHEKFQREAKVEDLRLQMESLKVIMGRNITLLLERGENLEMLVDKSNQMMGDTAVFKKRSRQLRSLMQWQYYKTSCLLTFLVIGVVWLGLSCVCGFNFSRCIPVDDED